MRKLQLGVIAILTAAAFAASAQTRDEPSSSPFVYEAIGATPAVGRKVPTKAVDSKTAPAVKAAAPAGTASTTFTYDAVGATPQVESKRTQAEISARRIER